MSHHPEGRCIIYLQFLTATMAMQKAPAVMDAGIIRISHNGFTGAPPYVVMVPVGSVYVPAATVCSVVSSQYDAMGKNSPLTKSRPRRWIPFS